MFCHHNGYAMQQSLDPFSMRHMRRGTKTLGQPGAGVRNLASFSCGLRRLRSSCTHRMSPTSSDTYRKKALEHTDLSKAFSWRNHDLPEGSWPISILINLIKVLPCFTIQGYPRISKVETWSNHDGLTMMVQPWPNHGITRTWFRSQHPDPQPCSCPGHEGRKALISPPRGCWWLLSTLFV